MNKVILSVLGLTGLLVLTTVGQAQPRPYIGYVYPAGGQQGTTFQIRLGGQNLDGVNTVQVSGKGVQTRVVEFYRRLNFQDMSLLREQVNVLKRGARQPDEEENGQRQKLIERIETRLANFVPQPACASIASLVLVEVTIASNAPPGARELTLATPRGASNPLVFHVGQFPEVTRKQMKTCTLQVLGKEEFALRQRPDEEVEERITLPCVANGQIAPGEVNRYRFEARQGQRLVFSVQARQLIPYIADAVPGWFQPALILSDSEGREAAYSDDYRFKPDPLITYEVPRDGEYFLTIMDAIYRGREDFVYRLTMGEVPFITSIFPLGARVGSHSPLEMRGWNLDRARELLPSADAGPGIHPVAAAQEGVISNRVPFLLDTLPEDFDKEPNNSPAHAQKVQLPVIINGRIDHPGDWDVFEVTGQEGDWLVAEVTARRLESPLDSQLKLTDASGQILAFNDDNEDPLAGTNTHHADSYLRVRLPADGTYYIHLGDTAHNGGKEYGYRLRLSAPQPDFALFAVPSTLTLRSKGANAVSLQVVRKDGFAGPIKLSLGKPPAGFSAATSSIGGNQTVGRLGIRTTLLETRQPVPLSIEGRAVIGDEEVVHQALPAEDRMQAFLWRHLVPAEAFKVQVFNPNAPPPPQRVPRAVVSPPVEKPKPLTPGKPEGTKPKFTKQQVAWLIRLINNLYNDGLLTDSFYAMKIAELEAGQ